MRLKGKTAVITGSGSGVGRAASLLFAREGATVVGVDIDETWGRETAELVKQAGGNADFIACDVGDEASVIAMADACLARHAKIHVLFNNAATLTRGDFEATNYADWKRQVAVNMDGPYLCTRHLLPGLKAAMGASIINHGSIDGALGNPTVVAYSVSKGGMIPLTHMLAHALAPWHVRVNCINTGWINASETGIPIRLTGELKVAKPIPENSGIRNATLVARPSTVEECARTVLFLASDESSYITGAIIAADGGRSALTPGTYAPVNPLPR